MSIKFLKSLNGNSKGRFAKYIAGLSEDPRIAWYPSAGCDFRDLVYLSQRYAEGRPVAVSEPSSPSLFLHTDYMSNCLPDNDVLYSDERTTVRIDHEEELPALQFPLDGDIVVFGDQARADGRTGRVRYMEVTVETDELGIISVPVVYAFVGNEAFCARQMLPNEAVVSHVVHVRYGGGFGGGYASGSWLLSVLARLQCQCFLTDGHLHEQSGDLAAYARYPILRNDPRPVHRNTIRTIRSHQWSNHGDVSWDLLTY